jgi:UDP:flavonoid glycosyltransferase YjiC (YdhE family)
MKFLLASLGSRGDVEPCAAIGRELQRRGHQVCMAVPPNFLGFIESAGLPAVTHGPDQVLQNASIERIYGKTPVPAMAAFATLQHVTELLPELGKSLTWLTEGADLLLTDASEQGLAANVAEYYGIPMAALHIFPLEPGGTDWQITKEAEDANAGHLACRRKRDPRRDNRSRSRPTTNSSFPNWQPNGPNTTSDGRSLAGSRWSCRRMPTTRSRRGLPREPRRSTSASAAACDSQMPLTRSRSSARFARS